MMVAGAIVDSLDDDVARVAHLPKALKVSGMIPPSPIINDSSSNATACSVVSSVAYHGFRRSPVLGTMGIWS